MYETLPEPEPEEGDTVTQEALDSAAHEMPGNTEMAIIPFPPLRPKSDVVGEIAATYPA